MMIALMLAAACSGDCKVQKQFDQMEAALVEAPVMGTMHAHAEGAFKGDVDATIKFTDETTVDFKGEVQGQQVDKNWEHATTLELRDSLLIGLTRMGIFHNLVNFARNRPPANIEGGVRQALQPHDFAKAKGGGIAYKLRIGNREMGDATIKFDPKTKLPVSRTLVAHIDQGEMRVTETYDLKRVK